MNKVFAVLVVLAILVIGLGFYRGWFALSSPASDTGSHKVNINLTLDSDKVKADAESLKAKTTALTGKATQGVNEQGDQSKDSQ